LTWVATGFAVIVPSLILWQGRPSLDHTAAPLRPLRSPAYDAMDDIQSRLDSRQRPFWLLIGGRNEREVSSQLETVGPALQQAVNAGSIDRFLLPTALWPNPDFQKANRPVIKSLLEQSELLRQAAVEQGFTSNSLAVFESMRETWLRAIATTNDAFWPDSDASRWVMQKFAARGATQCYALGMVYPLPSEGGGADAVARLRAQLPSAGVWLSGWELLGQSLLETVQRDFWKVMLPMAALVCGCLWLTFRRWAEAGLSLAVLFCGGLGLWSVMQLAGWSWNLLNLMALPLLLGAAVDYSIHTQLALRRHGGDIKAVRLTTGKALWLCGGTTVAGFSSLAWSSNAGLASLGRVCAVGVACVLLVSLYLLPLWWRAFFCAPASGSGAPLRRPSSLYRADLWRLGVAMGPWLDTRVGTIIRNMLARLYWLAGRHRREVVIQNLLPVLGGDLEQTRETSRRLFLQFARKLTDMWRFESGQPIEKMFVELDGWENFVRSQAKGRGVLVITLHLGNWELGGPLLRQRGVRLQVVSQAEPGEDLNELRQATRTRWGIETLIIGQDPFSFVEVIKRLEAGATVAVSIDRPLASSQVRVELFGRSFSASIAAAEFARLSGCALVPVCVVHAGSGYSARILPEIVYERSALGDRERRRQLTQQILRAFEPVIRQHPDQWYHFVSIWPEDSEGV